MLDSKTVIILVGSWRQNWQPLLDEIRIRLRRRSLTTVTVPALRPWLQPLVLMCQAYVVQRWLRRRIVVIASDEITGGEPRFGQTILFHWNTASELQKCRCSEAAVVDFFISQDCLDRNFSSKTRRMQDDAAVGVYTYAPPARYPARRSQERRVFFASEVSVELPADIVRVLGESNSVASWDEKIWEQARASLVDHATYRALIHTPLMCPTVASGLQWALINRIRYLFVSELKKKLGSRFVIWGSDWSKVGITDAKPSNFAARAIAAEYQNNRVSLDVGGKSCHAAVYPRVSDIFRAGGLPVQAAMPNSVVEWPCFNSLEDATEMIDRILAMPPDAYETMVTVARNAYSRIAEQACADLEARLIEVMGSAYLRNR